MANIRRLVMAFALLLLLAITLTFWLLGRSKTQTPPLSVTFSGWTNNPVRSPAPNRLELGGGATGQCALFWVTNTANASERVWFDTSKVQQKVNGQWREFAPTNAQWGGVGGSIWTGGYGCHYAIGVPPGLPTNAIWRLEIRCGRDLSPLKLAINSWLGRRVFRPSEDYVSLYSSELVP